MKATTAIGIGVAFVCLLMGVIMEGGNPMAYFNIPAAIVIGGGTMGALIASLDMDSVKKLPKLAILAFKGGNAAPDMKGAMKQMVGLAEKARRDGLLALEDDLGAIEDEFTRRGLQLVVDGVESDLVISILQAESDGMAQRHARNAKMFMTAGGFAPTIGVLGTVLSLVHVLENLSSPAGLGKSIAGAFLATLYGVGSANLIFLPVGNRLKEMSTDEQAYRNMLLEAVLSIQAGDTPRMLAEKLETYIAPSKRGAAEPAAEPESAERVAAQAA